VAITKITRSGGSSSVFSVRFVQYHNFASRSRRRVPHHLAQLADLVDAAVRRRVDLNHV